MAEPLARKAHDPEVPGSNPSHFFRSCFSWAQMEAQIGDSGDFGNLASGFKDRWFEPLLGQNGEKSSSNTTSAPRL